MEQQPEKNDFHVRLPPPDSTSPLLKSSHMPFSAQENYLPGSSGQHTAGSHQLYHYQKQQHSLSSLSPPPYAYSQQHDHDHDPQTLSLPQVPSTELPPLKLNAQDNSVNYLPPLASLTGPPSATSGQFGRSSTRSDTSYSPPARTQFWPIGNPYSAYYSPGHGQSTDSPARMEMDSLSSGTRGPLSPENLGGRASSVSWDDPDVKMAAEALGDLKAMAISSPRNVTTNIPSPSFGATGPEPQPLLSLVMTSGSVLARPIEGTVSAYNTTKNKTPGFVKTPVEYLEGVVGSGLHMAGIEGGVRWFFQNKSRQNSSSDVESGESSHKRRRIRHTTTIPRRVPDVSPLTDTNIADADPYAFSNPDTERRMSMSTIDSLPAYDDARSPAYTENAPSPKVDEKDGQVTPTTSRAASTSQAAWQQRFIMSTSGLSIAMSEESLRSLKYCLSWLRWANDHLSRVIDALKESLAKFDSHGQICLTEDLTMTDADPSVSGAGDPERTRREISARITALRSDVLKTLQGVIETVSKYASGALPDNARVLVRRHLTSLPARFKNASQESSTNNGGGSPASASSSAPSSSPEAGKEKEAHDGAQRVLVLAQEGLDMMQQVSTVLDGTIMSAEEWCDRLGRKRRNSQVDEGRSQQRELEPRTVPFEGVDVPDEDVKMG